MLSEATIKGVLRMATAGTPAPVKAPEAEQADAQPKAKWRKFVVPALIVLLAVVIFATITWDWNAWEGGRPGGGGGG
jgi:hypothetical protein